MEEQLIQDFVHCALNSAQIREGLRADPEGMIRSVLPTVTPHVLTVLRRMTPVLTGEVLFGEPGSGSLSWWSK